VEAKPLANIKAPTIQKFFWQNIVYRFGVPRELTVDNGKQLHFQRILQDLGYSCEIFVSVPPKVQWSS
jgi:hypothetical protein